MKYSTHKVSKKRQNNRPLRAEIIGSHSAFNLLKNQNLVEQFKI